MTVNIENTDAFKNWLIGFLTPICDADPQALAKYVLALIKKEKTIEELKTVCLSQLDVFLQERTDEFVGKLFEALNNKTYLEAVVDGNSGTAQTKASELTETSKKEEGDATKADSKTKVVADERRAVKSPSRPSPPRKSSRERSPHRERSPFRERRVLRSSDRSPARPNRRSVFARLDRRRSPDRPRGRFFGSRHDSSRRRRSHSRSPIGRRSPARRASRTPPAPHRSASIDRKRNVARRSASPAARDKPARSRSPQPKFRPRSWSMSSSGLSSSRSRSRTKSPAAKSRESRTSPARDANAGDKTPDSRGSTPRDYSPYNRGGTREIIDARDYAEKPPAKPRCRDYDEKGFCMRGDLCPYDHGNDAVVVDDVRLNNVLQLNQGPGVTSTRLPPPIPPTSVLSQLVGPGGSVATRVLLPRLPVPAPPAIAGPLAGLPINLSQPPPPHPAPFLNRPQDKRSPPPSGAAFPVRLPASSQQYATSQPAAGVRLLPANNEYNPEAPGLYSNRPPVGDVPILRNVGDAQAFSLAAGNRGGEGADAAGRQPQLNLVSVPTDHSHPIDTLIEPGNEPSKRIVVRGKRPINAPLDDRPEAKRPMFEKGAKKNFFVNNTSLELRKVPLDKNNIGSINEHFSKFGLITNLQVCYKGEPDAAVVTFATPQQAQAAYRCTEPVFNNRFVRIFFHNPDAEGAPGGERASDRRMSVKERLGTIIPPASKLTLNNKKKDDARKPIVNMQTTGLSKTVFNAEAQTQKPVPSSHKAADLNRRVEMAKKKAEIQKKKHNLLAELLSQQKSLIVKLENKKLSVEERKAVMKTVKVLADQIEKIKQELAEDSKSAMKKAAVAKSSPISRKPVDATVANIASKPNNNNGAVHDTSTPKSPFQEKALMYLQSKEKTRKALLDTELDIMKKEQSGVDTSSLQQKVAQLKNEAAALGLLGRGVGGTAARELTFPPTRGGRRGRGGRRAMASTRVIDRRPKQLRVAGFTFEEKDLVVQHLMSFGEFESIVHDDSIPSMLIDFKTRHDAEVAAREGALFKDKRLIMAWHRKDAVAAGRVRRSSSSKSPASRRLSRDAPSHAPQPATDDVDVEADEGEDDQNVNSNVNFGLDDPDFDGIDEDALLGYDDEDEDDDEGEKSWKR